MDQLGIAGPLGSVGHNQTARAKPHLPNPNGQRAEKKKKIINLKVRRRAGRKGRKGTACFASTMHACAQKRWMTKETNNIIQYCYELAKSKKTQSRAFNSQ